MKSRKVTSKHCKADVLLILLLTLVKSPVWCCIIIVQNCLPLGHCKLQFPNTFRGHIGVNHPRKNYVCRCVFYNFFAVTAGNGLQTNRL
jgi:hypothetical protein